MNKFDQIYNIVMNNFNYIIVQNIERVYSNLDIIYEDNQILKCPNIIFNAVKKYVQKSLNLKQSCEFKIYIKDIINDKYLTQFNEDQKLYSCLVDLFKNHQNAYALLKVQKIIPNNPYFSVGGMFQPPIKFIENFDRSTTLHLAMPKIKPLTIIDKQNVKKFEEKYKKQLVELKEKYSKNQILLKNFKENIINFQKFGEITIIPENCSKDNNSIDQLTLDEVIQHQCQHFYIFLLELAKTCIYFGRHFSNNIKDYKLYQLREQEFIPLLGTYLNILIKIYKLIPAEKSIQKFVKALIDLSIYDKTNEDQKYKTYLESSKQFNNISLFFKLIYQDSKYGLNTKNQNNEKRQLISFGNSKKFQKLVNWTIKNLHEGLKDE